MIYPFLTACLFGVGLSLLAFIPAASIWFSLPFTAVNVTLIFLGYLLYFMITGQLRHLLRKFSRRHLWPAIVSGSLGTFVSVMLVQYGWSLPWIDGTGVNSAFNIVAQQLDLIAALSLGVVLFRNRFTWQDALASTLVLLGVIGLGLVSGGSQYVFSASILYIGLSGLLFGAANIYSGVLGCDFNFKEVILIRFAFSLPLALLVLIGGQFIGVDHISYMQKFVTTIVQGGMDQSYSTFIHAKTGGGFWLLYLLLNYLLGYKFLVMAFSVTHRSTFNSIVMQFGPVITAFATLFIYYGLGTSTLEQVYMGVRSQMIPALVVMGGVIYHTIYTSRREQRRRAKLAVASAGEGS